jgi:hypothetical protein
MKAKYDFIYTCGFGGHEVGNLMWCYSQHLSAPSRGGAKEPIEQNK